MYKVLRTSFLLGLLLRTVAAFGQEDSLPYRLYNQKLVLYSDLGFNTAPIGIKYPYNDEIKRLRYRNNSNMVLGFGFSYKWMAARLGINLPVSLRSSRDGKTSYFDLGFDFTLKRVF